MERTGKCILKAIHCLWWITRCRFEISLLVGGCDAAAFSYFGQRPQWVSKASGRARSPGEGNHWDTSIHRWQLWAQTKTWGHMFCICGVNFELNTIGPNRSQWETVQWTQTIGPHLLEIIRPFWGAYWRAHLWGHWGHIRIKEVILRYSISSILPIISFKYIIYLCLSPNMYCNRSWFVAAGHLHIEHLRCGGITNVQNSKNKHKYVRMVWFVILVPTRFWAIVTGPN